jgi:hypothetical protein
MTNVTLTIADPTKRADGTALAATDLASINIWRTDGSSPAVQIGTLSPLASPLVFVDPNVAPGAHAYQVTVTDKQVPPLTSAPSDPFPVVIAAALAAPAAATITAATQA